MSAVIETTETTETTENQTTELTLSRAALAVAMLSTTTDDGRPALHRAWAKGAALQSADGFMAATVETPQELPEHFAISRADALAAVKKTRTKRRGVTAMPEDDGTVTLAFENKPGELLRVNGTFTDSTPDIANVLNDNVPKAVVNVDAKRLKAVAAFLETALDDGEKQSTAPMVEMRIFRNTQAIEFRGLTPDEHKVRAVLMPMVKAYHAQDEQWMFDPVEGESPATVGETDLRRVLADEPKVVADHIAYAEHEDRMAILENVLAALGHEEEIDTVMAVLGYKKEETHE